jgi:hypothetical protein
MRTRICQNCKSYCNEIIYEDDLCDCKRYPPRVIANGVGNILYREYPKVFPNDWCGDWEDRNDTN